MVGTRRSVTRILRVEHCVGRSCKGTSHSLKVIRQKRLVQSKTTSINLRLFESLKVNLYDNLRIAQLVKTYILDQKVRFKSQLPHVVELKRVNFYGFKLKI